LFSTNIFVSSKVALTTGDKVRYTKQKGFDKKYYQDLIIEFIKEHRLATREEINSLLIDKLPDILNEKQKMQK